MRNNLNILLISFSLSTKAILWLQMQPFSWNYLPFKAMKKTNTLNNGVMEARLK